MLLLCECFVLVCVLKIVFCYLSDDLFGVLFGMEKRGDEYLFGKKPGWEKDPCCYLVRLLYQTCKSKLTPYDEIFEGLRWEKVMKEGGYVYMQLFTKNYYADPDCLGLAYDRRGDRETRFPQRLAVVLDMGKIHREDLKVEQNLGEERDLSSSDDVWIYHKDLIRFVEDPNGHKAKWYPGFSSLYSKKNGYPFDALYERGVLVSVVPCMVRLGNFSFGKKLMTMLWNQECPDMDFKVIFSNEYQFENIVKNLYKNWHIKEFYSTGNWKTSGKTGGLYQTMIREYPEFFTQWINLRDEFDNKGPNMDRTFEWGISFCSKNRRMDEHILAGDSSFYKACIMSQTEFVVTKRMLQKTIFHLTEFWKLLLMVEYNYKNHNGEVSAEVREAPKRYMQNLGIEMTMLEGKAMRELLEAGIKMPGERKKP